MIHPANPPGQELPKRRWLEDDDWWLAIYVMLSRARKLDILILLGFTPQVEELLRRGPPENLIKVTNRLETTAATALERLSAWLMTTATCQARNAEKSNTTNMN